MKGSRRGFLELGVEHTDPGGQGEEDRCPISRTLPTRPLPLK